MEEKKWMMYNPSMEEEYKKYLERTKSEVEEENIFRAEYLMKWAPAFVEEKAYRSKLISYLKEEYHQNVLVRKIITECITEEYNSIKPRGRVGVEELIESNLYRISYLLANYILQENESLKKRLEDILLRQPIRIIGREGEGII